MEKSRKSLREFSIVVLLFAAITLIRNIIELLTGGLRVDEVTGDVSKEVLMVAAIISVVLSFVLLLPQLYVGFRGLKIAKEPASTKGHIVWAVILFVCAVISVFSSISSITDTKDIVNDMFKLSDHVLNALAFGMYIVYANRVLKGR